MKCDIIIPVYKAPEWVKLCVYALFTNTDPKTINKVYLLNDCDDPFTINCLENLKAKYGNKIILKHNPENLGFVKTVNTGLKLSTADNVLLLNSDCLIAHHTIEKLLAHLEKDSKIGLICPLASNAANLTIPIPEGWSYTGIDQLLEKHFSGKSFNACTIVGNCLMLTKKCIEEVGLLDEAYGAGYGEETDYQFKAMAKGFTAKVAIDTYVFHKAEASFGTSKKKQERLAKNRELFFSRWGDVYKKELAKYQKQNPIEYIKRHLPADAWKPKIKTLFYIDGIVQNAGGVHAVIDIVNYLTIHGESINILYNLKYPYQENMLFTPVQASKVKQIKFEQIVSTVWKTAFEARILADRSHAKLLSFIQGYESYFENGIRYGAVELSYKISDSLLTISDYLKTELKNIFNEDSTAIPNGINYDLIHLANPVAKSSIPTITIILRGNPMKGDWLLMDIIKHLNTLKSSLNINLISIDKKISLPTVNENININLLLGPQNRNTIYQILQNSDIYIDASLSEGFGLTALEAMAAGCVPIVSNSMGINEYFKDGKNGLIVNDVNNANSYIKAIKSLLGDPKLLSTLSKNGLSTAHQYDFDNLVKSYIAYFNNPKLKSAPSAITAAEKSLIESMKKSHDKHAKRIGAFTVAQKLTPAPVKKITTKVVNKLYHYLND